MSEGGICAEQVYLGGRRATLVLSRGHPDFKLTSFD